MFLVQNSFFCCYVSVCEIQCSLSGFFMRIRTSDKKSSLDFLSLVQILIVMKNPEFGKMLEQKLFRMVSGV